MSEVQPTEVDEGSNPSDDLRPRGLDRVPLQRLLLDLAALWLVPELPGRVRLLQSPRMTRTLARAYPKKGVIRISPRVAESAPEEILREILCHEAAHIAAYLKHQRRVRPHGREWQELMCQAGYKPRVRLSGHPSIAAPAPRRRPRAYRHVCTACGWVYLARTTNRRWRCKRCVRRGRDGRLVVTRLDSGRGRDERVR